ncbi:MAG: hypothetical protein IPF98_24945 [Gemmatimonadetes bacterium]|nr:hypothetical protein [Gemmatimonadota bacterium]
MSRVSMKSMQSGGTAAADLLSVAPRLLVLSMESAQDFVSRATSTLPAMPGIDAVRRSVVGSDDCGCDIPETDCPPRCVCEFHWEGSPGEWFHATIRVRNTSRVARQFSVVSTDLGGVAAGKLTVAPARLQLPGGAAANVAVSYHVPAGTAAGSATAELLVTGAYEQCVTVRLTVQPQSTITCEVAQGDPPRRVRTMHWYRHWQCEEPCEPPRPSTVPVPGTPSTSVRPAQPTG